MFIPGHMKIHQVVENIKPWKTLGIEIWALGLSRLTQNMKTFHPLQTSTTTMTKLMIPAAYMDNLLNEKGQVATGSEKIQCTEMA